MLLCSFNLSIQNFTVKVSPLSLSSHLLRWSLHSLSSLPKQRSPSRWPSWAWNVGRLHLWPNSTAAALSAAWKRTLTLIRIQKASPKPKLASTRVLHSCVPEAVVGYTVWARLLCVSSLRTRGSPDWWRSCPETGAPPLGAWFRTSSWHRERCSNPWLPPRLALPRHGWPLCSSCRVCAIFCPRPNAAWWIVESWNLPSTLWCQRMRKVNEQNPDVAARYCSFPS